MKFKIVYDCWWMRKNYGMVFLYWMWFDQKKGDVAEWHFRHELEHVYQYKKYGRIGFLLRYIWKWIRCGFSSKKHPMEIEARATETIPLTPVERRWFDTGRINV